MKDKKQSVYWMTGPKPGNFGDLISPMLAEARGHSIAYASEKAQGKIIGCGSVIKFTKPHDIIWGTGTPRATDKFPADKATFLAVRGPRTRKLVIRNRGVCPKVYGDPGLLLPRYFPAAKSKKYRIGIIPHCLDYPDVVKQKIPNDICIINLLCGKAKFKDVINQATSCEAIISSSLHGVILADAYGIPSCWMKFSDRIKGGEFKFRDYLATTTRGEIDPEVVSTVSQMTRCVFRRNEPAVDISLLEERCPV